MDNKLKLRYFKYYQDYFFYRKIDVEVIENFAAESLEKSSDDLYVFAISLLCQYFTNNQQSGKFFTYLSNLKLLASQKGSFAAVYVPLNEGYYQMMVEQNYNEAIKSFQKANNLYHKSKLNHSPTIYNITQFLGVCYCHLSDDYTAYQYFNQALNYNLNQTFRFHKAMTYNWLAIIESRHHLTAQALQKALKSADILKRYSIENRYADVLNTIGSLYIEADKYTEAEKSFKESIEIASKYNLNFIIADAYNNLGMLYKETNQNALSIENYLKSLEYRNPKTDFLKFGYTLMNLSNCYRTSEDYPNAMKYITQAIDIAKKFADENFFCKCYSNFAIIYLKLKDYKNTEKYLKLAEAIAQKINEPEGLMYVYNVYMDLYQEKKNFRKKCDYALLYIEKQKEVYEIKMSNTINFIKWKSEIVNS